MMDKRPRRIGRWEPVKIDLGLKPWKPMVNLEVGPEYFAASYRQPYPDRPASAVAIAHRVLPHQPAPANPRTEIKQTGDNQTVEVAARIPLGDRGEQLAVGFAASDLEGALIIALRNSSRETALAVRTDALASTALGRSRVRLTALGAAIGAEDSFEGAVAGGLIGFGVHLLWEAFTS